MILEAQIGANILETCPPTNNKVDLIIYKLESLCYSNQFPVILQYDQFGQENDLLYNVVIIG